MAKKTPARKKTAKAAPARPAKAPAARKVTFKRAKDALANLQGQLTRAGGRAPSGEVADALGKVTEAVRLVSAACAPAAMMRVFKAGSGK